MPRPIIIKPVPKGAVGPNMDKPIPAPVKISGATAPNADEINAVPPTSFALSLKVGSLSIFSNFNKGTSDFSSKSDKRNVCGFTGGASRSLNFIPLI